MFDTRRAPILALGNCEKYNYSWRSMNNGVPPGSNGNGLKTVIPPFGVTPFATPPLPYVPPQMCITRAPWEGWRYGENYMKTDLVDRPYGFPDHDYYRSPYCGPCCPCVSGTNPPLLGDPKGANPNIKYIPFDYRSLLGSGYAYQETPQVCPPVPFHPAGSDPGAVTSCGKDHCKTCSGVFNPREQPTKFQVCIGDPGCPDPKACPAQNTKVYVPMGMLPCGESEKNKDVSLTNMDKQDFEVTVPGREHAYGGQRYQCVDLDKPAKKPSLPKLPKVKSKRILDPCGCCAACNAKLPPPPSFPQDPTKCQIEAVKKST